MVKVLKQEKIGDIFSIELSNGQFGFGQVLWRKGLKLRIGIFNLINDSELLNVNILEKEGFIIIENTVRTFFKLNRWKIIGSIENKDESHESMVYKVHTIDGMVLMDIYGNIIGSVLPNCHKELEYEKSYSPISFSRALEVHHKIVEYDSYYEKILRV